MHFLSLIIFIHLHLHLAGTTRAGMLVGFSFSFINHSQIMIHAFRLRPRELVCWLVSVFVHFYFPYILFRLMQGCYGSLPLMTSAWVETSYVMTYCPRVRPPDSVIVQKCNVPGPPRQSWPIFEILVFSFWLHVSIVANFKPPRRGGIEVMIFNSQYFCSFNDVNQV